MAEKYHVMIVDDDASTRVFLKALLESNGCEISEAAGGAACLEMLQRTEPDLVLLDVNMPAPNGLEVCKKMKANASLSHIPIIFITAVDDTTDILKGYEAGALDYIVKPINSMTTLARVNAILNYQQLMKDRNNLLNANMLLFASIESFLNNIALEPKLVRIKREVTESIGRLFDLLEDMRRQMSASLQLPDAAGNRISKALENAMALLDEAQGHLQFGDRVVQQFNEMLKTVNKINSMVAGTPALDPATARSSTKFVLREKPSQVEIDNLLASLNIFEKK